MSSKSLLPPPFDWCEIPAGQSRMLKGSKGKQITELPSFHIGKYLITNAQYKLFVDAGGYEEKRWWTEAGWQDREKGMEWVIWQWAATNITWKEPLCWKEERFIGEDKPVVGVSWHEALAFCFWLSAETGETISLATEQQWQRAAQGDNRRVYPWGNKLEPERFNFQYNPSTNLRTSPVTQFEGKGDSPFGVVDMAGNLYEWTLSEFKTSSPDIHLTGKRLMRVMKGGSWEFASTIDFKTTHRFPKPPYCRTTFSGFRIVRNLD
jgi:formylglycine-generating enzyme required for sulfatase activity